MVDLSVKDMKATFFDRAAITDKVEKAILRGHAQAGAYVRTVARRSMRKRKKASPPGQPPSVHKGGLKDLLFFGYDAARKTTVVGPVKFSAVRTKTQLATSLPVPGQQEHGGTSTMLKKVFNRSGRKATERQKESFLRKIKDGSLVPQRRFTLVKAQAKYPPRPYMGPALETSKSKLPELFAR